MTVFAWRKSDPVPAAPPAAPDGTLLPLVWQADEGAVFGDSLVEMFATVFPDYQAALEADSDGQQALLYRVSAVAHFAQLMQEAALVEYREKYPDAELSEDFLTAVLTAKDGRIVVLSEWMEEELPLYLLTTQYEPFTEVPRPRGKSVVFLDPSTERGAFDALETLGFGKLLTRSTT